MNEQLPSPLVPADIDVRELPGFMLNTERLMASELVALSSHEAVAAALFLWCRAWKQVPAASLPNDERVIAAFARLPLGRFKKLRAEVLRGFVLCDDGRLYHRVLAVEALNAFNKKHAFARDAKRMPNACEGGERTGFKRKTTRVAKQRMKRVSYVKDRDRDRDRDRDIKKERMQRRFATPPSLTSFPPNLPPSFLAPKPTYSAAARKYLALPVAE